VSKKRDFNEDLRGMSPEALAARLESLEREAWTTRMQLGTATVKDTRLLREIRRNIARTMTEIRSRALDGPEELAKARADEAARRKARERLREQASKGRSQSAKAKAGARPGKKAGARPGREG
jgi:ribosomal protein L29